MQMGTPQQDSAARADVWRHAIDRAQLGLWDWDIVTDRCFYSASWFAMLGYGPDELPQRSDLWLELTHPDDRERAICSGARHLAGETGAIETELRMRHKSGRWIWVLDRGGVIERDADGRPLRAVGVQTDISRQKTAEIALSQAVERTQLALEASSTGIWQFDVDTQTSLWDQRTRAIFGIEPGEGALARETWHAFLHPDDKERTERAHALPVSTEHPTRVCYRLVRRDGSVRHVETLCKLLEVPGTSGRLVGTIRDITEDHEREQQLAAAARQDPLTGLLNRLAFEAVLVSRIAAADARQFALFYIDLDYFKALNDSLGHAAGDAALKQIAQAVSSAVPGAVMARMGGDEFALVLDVRDGDPATAAEVVLHAVRQVGPDSAVGRKLGASIGVAVVGASGTTPADVLARADDACYAAKARGRNRWQFEAERPAGSGMTAVQLVADLATGINEGRVVLFGQEIRALDRPDQPSGRIEVLARLKSRDGALISPVEFIPAAERFGMAAALDRHVIRTALRSFGDVLRRRADISLSFNLSAHTLSDPMLWSFVETLARQTGTPLQALGFEITETTAFTNSEIALGFVRQAREQNCRIGLDDFGAGPSSFADLRRFPVDGIKIDGAFIENIDTSAFDREVVRAICGMGQGVGASVMAEGIETPQVLLVLRELGVLLGQGYLLHRPEPLEQVIGRLAGNRQVAAG